MTKLNSHQIEAIKNASITPEQIFENLDDLNDEIAESWDQEEAQEKAKKDPTLNLELTS